MLRPVPRRVEHDVGSVLGHGDARVLAASRPLVLLLIVFGREKHRIAAQLHRHAVPGFGQADTRSAFADARRRIVLGAEEDADFTVPDGGGGIERVALHRVGSNDGIGPGGTNEAAERPFRQPVFAFFRPGGTASATENGATERQQQDFE